MVWTPLRTKRHINMYLISIFLTRRGTSSFAHTKTVWIHTSCRRVGYLYKKVWKGKSAEPTEFPVYPEARIHGTSQTTFSFQVHYPPTFTLPQRHPLSSGWSQQREKTLTVFHPFAFTARSFNTFLNFHYTLILEQLTFSRAKSLTLWMSSGPACCVFIAYPSLFF